MPVLFINARDIMELRQVSDKTAYKMLNEVIDYFGLPKEREISLKAYCERYNLREEQVSRQVEANRSPHKKSTQSL